MDVEGGQTARAGGTSVWAGSTLEWGVGTMGEGARNPLAALEWPEGTGHRTGGDPGRRWHGECEGSGTASSQGDRQVGGGRGACMRSWLGLGHMKGMWDAYGMAAAR